MRSRIAALLEQIRRNEITEITGNAFGCKLTLQDVQAVAAALKTNTSVTKLCFHCQKIGAEGAVLLADMLRTNRTIRELQLHGNIIGDQGASAIAAALEHNTSLTELHLAFNQISDAGSRSIAEAIGKSGHLVTLTLGNNSIGPDGAKALADMLKRNQSLQNLYLGNGIADDVAVLHDIRDTNHINDSGAEDVADALKINSTLKKLSLNDNWIGPRSASYLALSLQRNGTLEVLNLNGNHIGIGGAAIAGLLLENTGIRELYLSLCGLDWVTCTVIAKALQINRSLHILDLSFNQVNDAAADEFADSFLYNHTSRRLDLAGNRITEQGLDRFRTKINSGRCAAGLRVNLEGNARGGAECKVNIDTTAAQAAPSASDVSNSMGVILYNNANGSVTVYQCAARFFARSMRAGNASAARNLGLIHEYGRTGVINRERAAYYYHMAQSRGYVFPASELPLPARPDNMAAFHYDLEGPLNACKTAYQGGAGIARLVNPHVSRMLNIENIQRFSREHNYTYYGHANNLAGTIEQQKLTGFVAHRFLPTHIFYLFQMRVACTNPAVSEFLDNELRICMEMYVIRSHLNKYPKLSNAEKEFIAVALYQAMKISQLRNGQEYSVGVSYDVIRPGEKDSSHIVYVNFIKQDGAVIIRVDNLGHDGEKIRYHNEGRVSKPWIRREQVSANNYEAMANNHTWPVVIGRIDPENDHDALVDYLVDLCRANYLNYDKALPLIYAARFRHTTNRNEGFHTWFFTRKLQDKGNCVFKGFSVGMDIRSHRFDPEYQQHIGNGKYAYANHANPKSENPRKGLYRDVKRLAMRAAEDRNHQEIPLESPEARRLKP